MPNILFSEVITLIEPLIEELKNFPRTGESTNSVSADQILGRVDAALITLYTMAHTRSKKSDNMEEAANVWQEMFLFCGRCLEALTESGLRSTHGGRKSDAKLTKTQGVCGEQRDHLSREHVALQRQFEEAGLL